MSDQSGTPSYPADPDPIRPVDTVDLEWNGSTPSDPPAPLPPVTPHAGVRYAVLRLLMLITVGGVLYLVGLRDWLLLIAAFLISGIASYFVFMRQRDAAAGNIEHQLHDWSEKRHTHDSEA